MASPEGIGNQSPCLLSEETEKAPVVADPLRVKFHRKPAESVTYPWTYAPCHLTYDEDLSNGRMYTAHKVHEVQLTVEQETLP